MTYFFLPTTTLIILVDEQSLCLLVLADIDHIYEEGRLPSGFLTAFEAHMTDIVFTTKAFGTSFNPY